MNRDEAKNILLLYRLGTADEADLQVIEALLLAKQDAELAAWLKSISAQQELLRAKFQQIAVPAGLKEQIISEQKAKDHRLSQRRRAMLAGAGALVALLVASLFWFRSRPNETALAIYENQMVGVALRGYSMDLVTNDVVPIRGYLARNQAPSDFILPASLQKAEVAGCAVQNWQAGKVSLICFRTSKPLPPDEQGDLWLFVVDQTAVTGAPADELVRFEKVNQLTTAVWTKNGKLYLLGIRGDESELQKFL